MYEFEDGYEGAVIVDEELLFSTCPFCTQTDEEGNVIEHTWKSCHLCKITKDGSILMVFGCRDGNGNMPRPLTLEQFNEYANFFNTSKIYNHDEIEGLLNGSNSGE